MELLGLLEAIDLDSCERIPSYETGSLEESQCTVRGGRVAYVGKMRSLAGLRGLRLEATQEQHRHDRADHGQQRARRRRADVVVRDGLLRHQAVFAFDDFVAIGTTSSAPMRAASAGALR